MFISRGMAKEDTEHTWNISHKKEGNNAASNTTDQRSYCLSQAEKDNITYHLYVNLKKKKVIQRNSCTKQIDSQTQNTTQLPKGMGVE